MASQQALVDAAVELELCIAGATEVVAQRHALAQSRISLALATVQLRAIATRAAVISRAGPAAAASAQDGARR